jgi:hypothetical protein
MIKRSVIVHVQSFPHCGFIEETLGGTFGFVDTGGSFSVLGGGASGINDSGQIVGSIEGSGGFLYTGGSIGFIHALSAPRASRLLQLNAGSAVIY